jgi:hypothetical protein
MSLPMSSLSLSKIPFGHFGVGKATVLGTLDAYAAGHEAQSDARLSRSQNMVPIHRNDPTQVRSHAEVYPE